MTTATSNLIQIDHHDYFLAGVTSPVKDAVCKCHRCYGSGQFFGYGTCFRCGGSGWDPTECDWRVPASWTEQQIREWHDDRIARNESARKRAAAKRDAKQAAIWAANVAACPALQELKETQRVALDANAAAPDGDGGQAGVDVWAVYGAERSISFINDILSKAEGYHLSERQSAAVTALSERAANQRQINAERAAAKATRDAERAATFKEVPEGRVVITGKVLSIKQVESDYGIVDKWLIECDGYRVFGTVPAFLAEDAEVGQVVTFKANVQPKEAGFGFYKRPTKSG